MDTAWRTALWRQFGAAIDMLDNALVACPASLWTQRLWRAPRPRSSRRSSRSSGMSPFMRLSGLTCISQASRRRNLRPLLPLPRGSWSAGQPLSFLELQLYNMRHVQEHAAQLSLFLGQHGIPDEALDWVARAKEEPGN